jgi:hypothetical protein
MVGFRSGDDAEIVSSNLTRRIIFLLFSGLKCPICKVSVSAAIDDSSARDYTRIFVCEHRFGKKPRRARGVLKS